MVYLEWLLAWFLPKFSSAFAIFNISSLGAASGPLVQRLWIYGQTYHAYIQETSTEVQKGDNGEGTILESERQGQM